MVPWPVRCSFPASHSSDLHTVPWEPRQCCHWPGHHFVPTTYVLALIHQSQHAKSRYQTWNPARMARGPGQWSGPVCHVPSDWLRQFEDRPSCNMSREVCGCNRYIEQWVMARKDSPEILQLYYTDVRASSTPNPYATSWKCIARIESWNGTVATTCYKAGKERA